MALRSAGAAPASAITSAIDGVSSSVCLRRSTASETPRGAAPSPGVHSYSATVIAAVAVSKAKTSTGCKPTGRSSARKPPASAHSRRPAGGSGLVEPLDDGPRHLDRAVGGGAGGQRVAVVGARVVDGDEDVAQADVADRLGRALPLVDAVDDVAVVADVVEALLLGELLAGQERLAGLVGGALGGERGAGGVGRRPAVRGGDRAQLDRELPLVLARVGAPHALVLPVAALVVVGLGALGAGRQLVYDVLADDRAGVGDGRALALRRRGAAGGAADGLAAAVIVVARADAAQDDERGEDAHGDRGGRPAEDDGPAPAVAAVAHDPVAAGAVPAAGPGRAAARAVRATGPVPAAVGAVAAALRAVAAGVPVVL